MKEVFNIVDVIKNIIRIGKEKNLNEQDLCKLMEISKSGIYNWKMGKGEPSAKQIYILAEKLNISTDYILGLSVTDKKEKINITFNEFKLIEAYREKENMQEAVNKLLEINTEPIKEIKKIAE